MAYDTGAIDAADEATSYNQPDELLVHHQQPAVPHQASAIEVGSFLASARHAAPCHVLLQHESQSFAPMAFNILWQYAICSIGTTD